MYAGFSKFKITPTGRLTLAGYLKRGSSRATGIHDDIYGRICIFEEKRKIAVLLLLELLAVDDVLVKRIKKKIVVDSKRTAVVVCCTHTHSGPEVMVKQIEDNVRRNEIEQYRDYLIKKIEMGFKEARKEMKCSDKIELFYGEEEVEGVVTCRVKPERIIDNRIRLLLIKEKVSKRLRGCIANFACHPTVLDYQNLLYSGDIFGQAMQLTEEKDKIICLLTNGAEGDVSTRFTRREQSFREVERLGTILTQSIRACIKKSAPVHGWNLDFRTIRFEIPLKKIPSVAKIKDQIIREKKQLRNITVGEEPDSSVGALRKRESRIEGLKAILNCNRIGREKEESVEIIGLKIGRVLFISIPGELVQETRLEIVKEIPEDIRVLFLGLANDYLGYFPTEQLIKCETYEAFASRFDDRAAEILKEKIILLENEMFS